MESNFFLCLSFLYFVALGSSLSRTLSSEEITNGVFDWSPEDIVDRRSSSGRKTIDEVLEQAGTLKGSKDAAAALGATVVEGDMVVDPVQYELKFGNGAATYAGAASARYYRWPKGIIPYVISKDYDERDLKGIYAGMQMWHKKTCVRFVPHGSAEAEAAGHDDYIEIFRGTGCWANVGYLHWSSSVSLGSGCTRADTVAHEMGHVLGLSHEQQRRDRDDHILVLWDNIMDSGSAKHAYKKKITTYDHGQPYDYCSIMHYGPTAFAKRWRDFTMLPKNLDYMHVMGRALELSQTDVAIVNDMYQCNMPADPTPCEPRPCKEEYHADDCAKWQAILDKAEK